MVSDMLPQNWQWEKLEEVIECLDGKRIPLNSKEREKRKGDIPYYGANGQLDSVNDYIFDEELLLFAEDGGSWGHRQNCSYIIRGKSWVNNHAHVLRMKSNILIKFLESYLNFVDLSKYISGTTRGKLNQRRMKRIKIPVPPLETQRKIVAILERAEALKQKRAEANETTNKILQSVFLEMFGDPGKDGKSITELNTVCLKIIDIEHKMPKGVDIGIPFISAKDMVNDSINFHDVKQISEEDYARLSKRCKPEKGDILYSRIGTVGTAKLINTKNKFHVSYSLVIIKPDLSKINPLFLETVLNLDFVKIQAKHKTRGIGVPDLNLGEIRKLKIILPPLKSQGKFASIVKKVESMKEKQKASTEEINTLFDALMQKAFNGELVN